MAVLVVDVSTIVHSFAGHCVVPQSQQHRAQRLCGAVVAAVGCWGSPEAACLVRLQGAAKCYCLWCRNDQGCMLTVHDELVDPGTSEWLGNDMWPRAYLDAGDAAQEARMPGAVATCTVASTAAGTRASTSHLSANSRDSVGGLFVLPVSRSAQLPVIQVAGKPTAPQAGQIFPSDASEYFSIYRLGTAAQGVGSCRFVSVVTPWRLQQSWPCWKAPQRSRTHCSVMLHWVLEQQRVGARTWLKLIHSGSSNC
jgi:hypothetical protein